MALNISLALTIFYALKAWYSAGDSSHIKKSFENSDANKNGQISIDEAYDLVLLIYLKINREAPVDPPTRNKVVELFKTADTNSNGKIEFEEFKRLMMILMSRAETPVVMYKVLTTIVAPLLSLRIVTFLATIKFLEPLLTNQHEALLTTLLTIFFIGQLGDAVLRASTMTVDFVLVRKKKVC